VEKLKGQENITRLEIRKLLATEYYLGLGNVGGIDDTDGSRET
jgi:hypothetical protein